MPDFDGGHYFLSSLIPIRLDLTPQPGSGSVTSHTQAIQEILSILPRENSCSNDPSGDLGNDSPFSRNQHTHFCRMVVIDRLPFVGRQHQDALITAIRKTNPVIPGPVDCLPNNFLALIVDFDAADGRPETLRRYLQELYRQMPTHLSGIFQHCVGFDRSAPEQSFVRQVMQGQIETTMSFNDYYWQGEPGLWQGSPALPNKLPRILFPPVAVGLASVIALSIWGPLGWLRALLIAADLGVMLAWTLKRLLRIGMEPFPTAPRSDLPSILKALYLQRQFIDFMIANQGAVPEQLQAQFRQFVSQHKPSSVAAPTQAPGYLPS